MLLVGKVKVLIESIVDLTSLDGFLF